jgi:hypothetical protein
MNYKIIFYLSLVGAGLSLGENLGAAPADAVVLYRLPPWQAEPLAGWERPKGYGGPGMTLEEATGASNSLPAITLDSQRWWTEAGEDSIVDTIIVGDTGVIYERGSGYVLTFHFARYDTAPHRFAADASPFFGALAYQVWVGHPDKNGVLIAAGAAAAVKQVTVRENGRIELTVPAEQTASGTIHLRFLTRWGEPTSDLPREIYQQGEISDLRIEKQKPR